MSNASDYEMIVERTINAPRELVWEAWTNAKHIKKWWGPKGFTNPICEWPALPGSKILVHMQAPDGIIFPMSGEFIEISKHNRLIFTSRALDKNGNPLFEVLNTVVFAEQNGTTLLTINAKVSKITIEARSYLDDMNEGWNLSIDRLEELLKTL